MIISAEEFINLINSNIETDNRRAITEEADERVWETVIAKYPDYETFILQNETIPPNTINLLSKSKNWKTSEVYVLA